MFGNSIIFPVIPGLIIMLAIGIISFAIISTIKNMVNGRKNINNNTIGNENTFMRVENEERTRRINEESLNNTVRECEESIKTVTPVELGGYNMDQGNSFNDINNIF